MSSAVGNMILQVVEYLSDRTTHFHNGNVGLSVAVPLSVVGNEPFCWPLSEIIIDQKICFHRQSAPIFPMTEFLEVIPVPDLGRKWFTPFHSTQIATRFEMFQNLKLVNYPCLRKYRENRSRFPGWRGCPRSKPSTTMRTRMKHTPKHQIQEANWIRLSLGFSVAGDFLYVLRTLMPENFNRNHKLFVNLRKIMQIESAPFFADSLPERERRLSAETVMIKVVIVW